MTIKGRPIKDVWHYIVGNYRYKIYYSGFKTWLLRDHIREQIDFRLGYVPDECWSTGSCKECGCQVPHLQMCHKSCDANCYPELMNSTDWHTFKQDYVVRQKNKFWRRNSTTNVLILTQDTHQYVPERRSKIR